MPSSRSVLAVGVLLAGGLAVPALADKPTDHDTTKTSNGAQVRHCTSLAGDDNTVTLTGPQVLWPPNHKMVDETVVAQNGSSVPPTGQTSLTLYAADVDDVMGGDGNTELDSSGMSTNADSDMDGTVVTTYQVRAERSGKGDGRTYEIQWAASFDDGTMCASEDGGTGDKAPFVISVPHDQGKGNDA